MSKFPAPLASVTLCSAYNKQTKCTDPAQLLAALSSDKSAYAIELRLHGVPEPMGMTRTDGLSCLLKMLLEQELVEADSFDARTLLQPRYMRSPRHVPIRPRSATPSFGTNGDAKSTEVRDNTLAVLFAAVAKFNAFASQLTSPYQSEPLAVLGAKIAAHAEATALDAKAAAVEAKEVEAEARAASAGEEVRLAESAKLRAELAEKLGAKVAEAAELRAKLAEATEIAEVEANDYW